MHLSVFISLVVWVTWVYSLLKTPAPLSARRGAGSHAVTALSVLKLYAERLFVFYAGLCVIYIKYRNWPASLHTLVMS
jgi:hypothetical protein